MKESPKHYATRTGQAMPVTDVRAGGEELGTVARPVGDDEVVPTLYRDVGPQALGLFHEGALVELQGPGSSCIFMRDATLPGRPPRPAHMRTRAQGWGESFVSVSSRSAVHRHSHRKLKLKTLPGVCSPSSSGNG